jgi:hypothetical protein
MTMPPSAAANLPLPRWAYIPGLEESDADHDTLWQAKALVPSAFRGYVPARHPALRYGIALNDHGFYWADANGFCCGPVSRSPTPT